MGRLTILLALLDLHWPREFKSAPMVERAD